MVDDLDGSGHVDVVILVRRGRIRVRRADLHIRERHAFEVRNDRIAVLDAAAQTGRRALIGRFRKQVPERFAARLTAAFAGFRRGAGGGQICVPERLAARLTAALAGLRFGAGGGTVVVPERFAARLVTARADLRFGAARFAVAVIAEDAGGQKQRHQRGKRRRRNADADPKNGSFHAPLLSCTNDFVVYHMPRRFASMRPSVRFGVFCKSRLRFDPNMIY